MNESSKGICESNEEDDLEDVSETDALLNTKNNSSSTNNHLHWYALIDVFDKDIPNLWRLCISQLIRHQHFISQLYNNMISGNNDIDYQLKKF